MCEKADKIVFSCPLDNGKKVVSMCAAGDVGQGQGHFYYAYGRPSAPELVFPGKDQPADGAFTRTHLGFAGNTGGYAYAFLKDGYKYIVYSVSGESNLRDGGVIVQRPGETTAAKKSPCQAAKIIESQDDNVIDATLKWKSDSDIQSHGLPSLH
ncbi:hypothetical protein DVJ77_04595 [Dyella tabacisoli]|uniref:Uncharacterized protein n=2 Tax=Dyella tabacisoli TaxID=2282381 RepID=A0A369UQM0_9GAMM|nr:hypothetical protein DVJ77_04595 [Dyella tabacisoli]